MSICFVSLLSFLNMQLVIGFDIVLYITLSLPLAFALQKKKKTKTCLFHTSWCVVTKFQHGIYALYMNLIVSSPSEMSQSENIMLLRGESHSPVIY